MSAIPRGSRVRFPLPPAEGESLHGFVDRVAAHNLYPDLMRYLRKAGLLTLAPDELHRNASQLAEFFGQTPAEMLRLVPKPLGKGIVKIGDRVLFGGNILVEKRRIAPVVLRERGIDLLEWGLLGRSVCMESWSILIDRCQNPACATKLDWRSSTLFTCTRCGADLRKAKTSYIKPEHRGLLNLGFARTIEDWRASADEHLCADLRGISYEECRDLLMAMTKAMRECKDCARLDNFLPDYYPSGILDACHALANPQNVRSIAAGDFGHSPANALRAKLRAVSSGNESLQHAIKAVTGIHSLTEIDHERTITSVAAKLKIPRGKLRSLVRVGNLRVDSIMGGDHRRYDEVRIDELNTLMTDRIPASSLAKMFQLKDRYIIALAEDRVLEAMGGMAWKLYREVQFHRSLAIPYLTGLAEKVLRHEIDARRMSLSEVMARLPPGPKPWASIFALAEAGDLEGGLGSLAPTGLDASKLTLSSSFANKLISGEIELERPFWPCDPEACNNIVRSHYVATSLSEAEEALGLYPRDMQALLREGYLEMHDGRVRWMNIKKCAWAIIGTRELAARAEIEPLKLGVEAAKRGLQRLVPRVGVWSRRNALLAFGLPRNPSDRFKPPKPGLSVRIGL